MLTVDQQLEAGASGLQLCPVLVQQRRPAGDQQLLLLHLQLQQRGEVLLGRPIHTAGLRLQRGPAHQPLDPHLIGPDQAAEVTAEMEFLAKGGGARVQQDRSRLECCKTKTQLRSSGVQGL